ncbi:MAG TPA: hypothetical protein VNZ03_10765 [Terriglobales bacterium]|nr:hypothetical protein [Terriglobales bacterium]
MLRSLLRSLLKDLLIAVALLAASATLPFASFWLVSDPVGGQLFFWLSPWTCAVWTVFVSVLVGSRFWLGREHVLAWRAARGGYLMSSLKSTALMFLALLASYGFEFAVILLLPRSPTSLRLLVLAAYAPAGMAAVWSARG